MKLNKKYKFIDLFAGIGGFHIGMSNQGAQCVFVSEIDNHARATYKENFYKEVPEIFDNDLFNNDITEIDHSTIPDFDILCGGFPCQPFSQAGYKKGFDDDRGNLFFHIANIIDLKRPKAFFLENVRHLLKHDDGKTFDTIKNIIEKELGYSIYFKIVKASDFGLPQHRARIFIVGFKNDTLQSFKFPEPIPLKMTMSDIWDAECSKKVGYTLRVGGRGSSINDRRNWDSYLVNGEVKRISSVQGKKMQGFPDDFVFPVSETQAMKQLGNSVAIPAIEATAESIIKYLEELEKTSPSH
ncbi:DNA cytosine methyltransferase [Sulfurimonas sp.]|uniref:DNA cytosine methyltransferase n=1 Tax=Sulfurimonas sp. TaxID=2022749 RepID=UPI0019E2AE75|nr:DNA cytosine methyltransferase [Sulfurimonas sp.]MBE0514219.1 DNA cytosine methyltransferase [Sulfurimonas sp.]